MFFNFVKQKLCKASKKSDEVIETKLGQRKLSSNVQFVCDLDLKKKQIYLMATETKRNEKIENLKS